MANHDPDIWREQKMTQAELHYLGLSEVYLSEINELYEPVVKILQAKGVVIELESDLLAHLAKRPASDRSKQQEDRILILKDVLDEFDKISSINIQMKLTLRKSSRDLFLAKKELEEVKRELELKNKSLDD